MSDTWHHSKKVGHFNPRARVKWRVRTYCFAPRWSDNRSETHTYVSIMTVPAWYRRLTNRLWRRATAREAARYGEIRTIRPRSAWDYW